MTRTIRIAKGSSARSRSPFAPVEAAIAAFRAGQMVIVVDDEDRENEGDLTMAAEMVTPEAINFMATHGRGWICLAMTPERLDALEIPLQVQENSSRLGTAMCVGIEAKDNTSTGISARDRATTIRTAIDPTTRPSDLARPGHIIPLRARSGGVLVRTGHTEAAVDLARAAGLAPAGVICEISKKDGEMARVPDLAKFGRKHGLLMITIADLVRYRLRHEQLVQEVATAKLPTDALFWCAGCQGTMYPLNGNVSATIGHVQASRLALARFSYKLHRELVAWGTMGSKGLCGKYLMPVMRKQQYRFQATNPNPQTKGRYACAPIGASTTFMSAGQVYPAIGEDMGYLVWRKRNCCAL